LLRRLASKLAPYRKGKAACPALTPSKKPPVQKSVISRQTSARRQPFRIGQHFSVRGTSRRIRHIHHVTRHRHGMRIAAEDSPGHLRGFERASMSAFLRGAQFFRNHDFRLVMVMLVAKAGRRRDDHRHAGVDGGESGGLDFPGLEPCADKAVLQGK
jgi:hypothetical protein